MSLSPNRSRLLHWPTQIQCQTLSKRKPMRSILRISPSKSWLQRLISLAPIAWRLSSILKWLLSNRYRSLTRTESKTLHSLSTNHMPMLTHRKCWIQSASSSSHRPLKRRRDQTLRILTCSTAWARSNFITRNIRRRRSTWRFSCEKRKKTRIATIWS